MKKLIKVLIIVLLLLPIAFYYLLEDLKVWSNTNSTIKRDAIIKLEKGISLNSLSEILESQKLIDSKLKFKIYVKYYKNYKKFKAGLYKFEQNISPNNIISKFINGEIYTPLSLKFTIKEASNINEVCKVISDKKISSFLDCRNTFLDKNLLKEYNLEGSSFEGYLYPATYFFYKKPTLKTITEKFIKNFKKNIDQNLINKLKEKKLSLYKALTFASLIEKEVADKTEYNKVSEVIWNRLNKNIALGIDAAVIYGIKKYKGDITFKHLRDKNNLYNLRIHRGLPPTPICSPSKEALTAILNPTNKGYFYYVHDIENGAVHHFSTNLKEHNRYVRKLKNWKK